MKITDWTWYGNPKYKELDGTWIMPGQQGQAEYDMAAVRELIVREIKEKGYKFTGSYHQNGDFGCPVLDGKYIVLFSCREWGQIIEDAYKENPGNKMAYCLWAWVPPDGAEEILPGQETKNKVAGIDNCEK